MNDVTQTTPVMSEDEMSTMRSFFERAANTIVQASQLAKDIQSLSADFKVLKSDLEHFRQKYTDSEAMLSEVRNQRDNAQSERDAIKDSLHTAQMQINSLTDTNSNQAETIQSLRTKLERALSDSDGWMQAAEKSDNDLQAANAKLAKLRDALGIVEPKPEPTPAPQPVAQTLPVGSAHADPVPTYNDPFPTEPSKPSSDDTLHTDTPTSWKSW